MLHEQSNFQKPSPSKKKGLAPLGQLHKEGLVPLSPLILRPPQRQKDVAANELVQDLGLGRQTREDHLLPIERHRELPALPVHAPALHGTEAPRPEHLALGADSQQAARGYAEDLPLLPRVVDAHGEVADAVGGQGLPRLDVAPLGRVQLKITYGRVRFHNLVIQLKKWIKLLVNMKFAIKWNIRKNYSSLF